MKAKIFRSQRLALVLGGILFVAGRWQSPSVTAADIPQDSDAESETVSAGPPSPSENIIEPPATATVAIPQIKLSASVAEIVKLAQSGVEEEVLLAYIGTMKSRFGLGSDQIVYLNDVGISGAVVKAMIQRDAVIDADGAIAIANNTPPAAPDMAPPYPPDEFQGPPMPPTDDSGPTVVADNPIDYTTPEDTAYFYDSLAPYGSWIFVSGVGRCWRPTVCVRDRDWRPYGDCGRWVSTDCGWYWQSDYSWGWAAFHYGRWFRDEHRGWAWAPDRVWGPAWVSWRHSDEYCGWAPLPPAARFVPGVGFRFGRTAVGREFEFGLRARQYTFIPVARMSDYAPARYSLLPGQSAELYRESKVINHVTYENHRVVSHGIDPKQVAKLSGTEIRTAEIRDLPRNSHRDTQADRVSRRDDKLVIFRPQLPVPNFTHAGRLPVTGAVTGGAPKVTTSPTVRTIGTVPPTPTEHKAVILVPSAAVARPAVNPPNSLILTGPKKVPVATASPTPLPNMNLSHQLDYSRYAHSSPAQPGAAYHTALPPVPDSAGRTSPTIAPGPVGLPNKFMRVAATPTPTLSQPNFPRTQATSGATGDPSRFNHTQQLPLLNESQPSRNTYTPASAYQPRSVSVSPTYSHPQSTTYSPPTPSYQAPQYRNHSETAAPVYHSSPVLTPPSYSRSESAPAPSYHSAPVESHASSAPAPIAVPASHSSSSTTSSSASSSTVAVPGHR